MSEMDVSTFPLRAADGNSPWSHIKVCGFLFNIVVLCTPLAWAQAPPLTEVAAKASEDAVPLASHPQAPSSQAKLLFTSSGKISPSCVGILSQTQSEAKLLCASSRALVTVADKSVSDLAAKQDYLSANPPKQWLTNPPDGLDYVSLFSHDLKYYGDRTPFIGKAIVRIAEQADAHRKITRVLLMIDPQF
jgi:hypothetical protein